MNSLKIIESYTLAEGKDASKSANLVSESTTGMFLPTVSCYW